MSATTFAPEMPRTVVASPKTNVVTQWYAQSVKAARDLYRSGVGYAESGLKWLLEHVPPAVIHAVAVAAFATKKGYHALVDSSFTVLRWIGKAINWVATYTHIGISWLGNRIGDAVAMASPEAGAKVHKANLAFATWRRNTATIVAAGVTLVTDEINESAKAPAVTGLINTVAAVVLAGIGLTALSLLTGPLAGVASVAAAVLGFAASIPIIGPVLGVGAGLVSVATMSSITGVVAWLLKIVLIATTIEMVFRGGKLMAAFKGSVTTVEAEPTIPEVVVAGQVVDGEELVDSIIAASETVPKPGPKQASKKHRAHK